MNTTKKFFVIFLVALLAVASAVPTTYSWYVHNSSQESDQMSYTRTGLPVSMKTGNGTLSVTTVTCDQNRENEGSEVTSVNVPAGTAEAPKVQYYKTTLTNTGANDVYAELDLMNLLNSTDISVGIYSPVINEKNFASRASIESRAPGFTRVYFQSNKKYSTFWYRTASGKFDYNLRYYEGSEYHDVQMSLAGTSSAFATNTKSNGDPEDVYYYDIPSTATSFFFFNHYFYDDPDNADWNRTDTISDFTPGLVYRLTGEEIPNSYKLYDTYPVNDNLIAINKEYTSATTSLGSTAHADLGMKKVYEGDDEDEAEKFTPDYYGNSITYTVADTDIATVNKDGLVTPKASGTTTVTTKIRSILNPNNASGKEPQYTISTTVKIPSNLEQVPVAQNILVSYPGKEETVEYKVIENGSEVTKTKKVKYDNKVELYWYVINRSTTTAATASEIFYTI